MEINFTFDNILSNKSKKNKKNADENSYFSNTNEIIGMYKNPTLDQDDDEEEKEEKINGKSLLKRIYGGSNPSDTSLYLKAKKIADKTYKKPSAYKSGFIQKKYKELGGEYDNGGDKPLKRWFQEKWKDIGDKEYPVYRPTKRISKKTPLTATEIDTKQALKQIALKQKIKGDKNLPPFSSNQLKEGGGINVPVKKLKKTDLLFKISNPIIVQKKANEIYGKDAIIYKSDKPQKKYKILNKFTGKFVYFGDGKMEDHHFHQDDKRRENYLKRAKNIKGNWKTNPYSPNNLSISLLWDGIDELV
jgi:hypothetical protein